MTITTLAGAQPPAQPAGGDSMNPDSDVRLLERTLSVVGKRGSNPMDDVPAMVPGLSSGLEPESEAQDKGCCWFPTAFVGHLVVSLYPLWFEPLLQHGDATLGRAFLGAGSVAAQAVAGGHAARRWLVDFSPSANAVGISRWLSSGAVPAVGAWIGESIDETYGRPAGAIGGVVVHIAAWTAIDRLRGR